MEESDSDSESLIKNSILQNLKSESFTNNSTELIPMEEEDDDDDDYNDKEKKNKEIISLSTTYTIPETINSTNLHTKDVTSPSKDLASLSKEVTSLSLHTNEKYNKILPSSILLPSKYKKIETDLAPYHVFEPDFIDINNKKDPLEVVIPNNLHMIHHNLNYITKLKEKNKEEKEQTNSIRESLFNRFIRDPTEENASLQGDSYLAKQELNKQRLLEKANRIRSVNTWIDASTSVLKNAMKRTRDASLHKQTGAVIASLNHALVARLHRNSTPDLSEMELKYFHRPRMSLKEKERVWRIALRTTNTQKASKKAIASMMDGEEVEKSTVDKTQVSTEIGGKLLTSEQEKQNLSLSNSSQSTFVLLEYIEEFPPVVLNTGMASAIINYYRNVRDQNTGEDNADQTNSESNANNNDIQPKKKMRLNKENKEKLSTATVENIKKVLQENNLRLPKHVMVLWELRNTKRPYEYDANIPKLPLGQTKVLNAEDKSPFLGEIEEGEIQPSIVNNLFRAPIFQHCVAKTDFLLVRYRKQKDELSFVLREIPYLFLVGQIEPRRIVPSPGSSLTNIQEKYFKLALTRLLLRDNLSMPDIFRSLLKYSLTDKRSPQRAVIRKGFRDILHNIATEDKTGHWSLKESGDETAIIVDSLVRSLSPEEICLQEATAAGEYRLLQQFIPDIDLAKLQAYLNFLHQRKQYQKSRVEEVKKILTEYYGVHDPNDNSYLSKLARNGDRFIKHLINEIHRLDVKLSIARFILERVVNAPWNTTTAFVRSVIEQDNLGKMEINGIGDPSGRGEAFAFVRIPRNNPYLVATGKKVAPTKLVGTENDLRKLHAKDAIELLVALGVKKSEATALKRWDRIHMVREMVDKLEKSGVSHTLGRYVRDPSLMEKGKHKGLSDEEFKKVCQEIWIRQKLSLGSALDPNETSAGLSKEALKREKKKIKMQENLLKNVGTKDIRSSSTASFSSAAINKEEEKGDDQGNNGAKDSDTDSDDSDLAEDIERTLTSRAQNNQNSLIESNEQEDEVNTKTSDLFNPTTSAEPTKSIGVQKLEEALTLSPKVREEMSNWPRPKKVVRRLTKTISSDGKELIKIEFILQESEVLRVEKQSLEQKALRNARRVSKVITANENDLVDTEDDNFLSNILNNSTVPSSKMTKHASALPSDPLTMSLKFTMKKKPTQPDTIKSSTSSGLKTSKSSSKLADEVDLKSFHFDDEDDDVEYNYKLTKRQRTKDLSTIMHPRLPIVTLAGRFEKIILYIWSLPIARDFHYPVDPNYNGYATIIKNPICLSDILNKNSRFLYESSSQLLDDFRLMSSNAEQFNGKNNPISENSRKLIDFLIEKLELYKKTLGADRDWIIQLEEKIKQKKVYLHNYSINSTANN